MSKFDGNACLDFKREILPYLKYFLTSTDRHVLKRTEFQLGHETVRYQRKLTIFTGLVEDNYSAAKKPSSLNNHVQSQSVNLRQWKAFKEEENVYYLVPQKSLAMSSCHDFKAQVTGIGTLAHHRPMPICSGVVSKLNVMTPQELRSSVLLPPWTFKRTSRSSSWMWQKWVAPVKAIEGVGRSP